MIVSVCIPVFNFYVFQDVYEYPVTFTWLQFFACALASLAWNFNVKHSDTTSTTVRDCSTLKYKLLAFSIPGVIMGVNTALNNLGLARTSATLSILIKQTQCVWALLLDFIVFKNRPTWPGLAMVTLTVSGTVLIGVSALLYQGLSNEQVSAVVMLVVSALLSAVYTVVLKRCQKWLKAKQVFCHPTEATYLITAMSAAVMAVIGAIFETNAIPELIGLIPDLKNMVLVCFVGGCAMTTVDKLCAIFLMQRNTLVDWSIISDAKTVPKIVLDVLINNKYPFDGFSISGGLLILGTQIVWAVLSPNKKHSGEGAAGNSKQKEGTEGEPLIVEQK